mmetsp:Transcript_95858/g.166523  ORF Transcript_95858/g.166523 Transcript_95858/m.166523 type:complete len:287 (-) Transcript_95858:243-1103(-)
MSATVGERGLEPDADASSRIAESCSSSQAPISRRSSLAAADTASSIFACRGPMLPAPSSPLATDARPREAAAREAAACLDPLRSFWELEVSAAAGAALAALAARPASLAAALLGATLVISVERYPMSSSRNCPVAVATASSVPSFVASRNSCICNSMYLINSVRSSRGFDGVITLPLLASLLDDLRLSELLVLLCRRMLPKFKPPSLLVLDRPIRDIAGRTTVFEDAEAVVPSPACSSPSAASGMAPSSSAELWPASSPEPAVPAELRACSLRKDTAPGWSRGNSA